MDVAVDNAVGLAVEVLSWTLPWVPPWYAVDIAVACRGGYRVCRDIPWDAMAKTVVGCHDMPRHVVACRVDTAAGCRGNGAACHGRSDTAMKKSNNVYHIHFTRQTRHWLVYARSGRGGVIPVLFETRWKINPWKPKKEAYLWYSTSLAPSFSLRRLRKKSTHGFGEIFAVNTV